MQLVPPGGMEEHRSKSAELHVQLLERRLAEKEASAASSASLEDRMQKLEFIIAGMKSTLTSLAKTQHVSTVTKQSTEAMRLDIRKHFSRKVMWKITNVSEILEKYPRGKILASENFCFGGVTDFHFCFQPNGAAESQPGKCALFLQGPPGQNYLHAKLSLNQSERTLTPHESGWQDGFGATSFWDIPLSTDDAVVITAEVLDSAQVVHAE